MRGARGQGRLADTWGNLAWSCQLCTCWGKAGQLPARFWRRALEVIWTDWEWFGIRIGSPDDDGRGDGLVPQGRTLGGKAELSVCLSVCLKDRALELTGVEGGGKGRGLHKKGLLSCQ